MNFFQDSKFFAFCLYQDPFKYILGFLIFFFFKQYKQLNSVGYC